MNSDKKLLKIKQSKADRRIAEKICKYLRRDEFRKLETSFFAADDKIHPDSVLNKRGMTGLMISSKLGHPDCVNVFLRKGASRKLTCFKGNIALHYAAKYCMKHPYPSNVRNLVTIPFLDSTTDYQELMKMPNNNGTTPKLLLDALNKIRTNIMNILASLTSGKTQDTKTNLTKPKTNGLTEFTRNFPGCKAGIISVLKVKKMQKKIQKMPLKRKTCCSKFPRKPQKQSSRHCSETNCLNYLTPKTPSW